MDSLGVGVVELPAFPANEYGQAMNCDLLARAQADDLQIEFAAHARCVAEDVRAACAAGFRRLHLYIGTSKIKQATARAGVQQLAEKAFDAISLARELGATCVRISTEDAFRTTLEDYETFYACLQARLAVALPHPPTSPPPALRLSPTKEEGESDLPLSPAWERGDEGQPLRVDGIGIPDTVGLATIDELGDRIAILRKVGIAFDWLECHVHNDIGNADRTYVDTLLLCQRLGITMLPDFSILGIGERNGTIGLSSLLESIYRRLILLYPRKMAEIRQAMREKLGRLASGELFVNRYRDMDAFFYRILSRTGFIFDRSPFSANTEYDGSGVHADTTMRAYQLALAEHSEGQAAIDLGNSAYSGALPPYDMPLRMPALACFGCGKANVRYWREHERLALRTTKEIRERTRHLEDVELAVLPESMGESAADDLIAQIIRRYSIKYNGIKHQEAMELVLLFYEPSADTGLTNDQRPTTNEEAGLSSFVVRRSSARSTA
jgi:hypothetical protein